MSHSEKRSFDNVFQPITIDEASLKKALKELQASLFVSVNALLKHAHPDVSKDSIYVGASGESCSFPF